MKLHLFHDWSCWIASPVSEEQYRICRVCRKWDYSYLPLHPALDMAALADHIREHK